MDSSSDRTFGFKTQTWRRISQTVFLFLLNPWLHRFVPGQGAPDIFGVCFPALNCWSCPAASLACPIGAAGQLLARGVVPLLTIGVMVFAAVLLGRLFCGWMCPFGLIQDLMHKIPSSAKFRPPHSLRHLKYVLLAVTVILIPIFFGVAPGLDGPSGYFYCSLCPAGTLEASIPINFQLVVQGQRTLGQAVGGLLGSVKFWILVFFLVGFVYFHRPFCKIACPIGAFLGLFNRFSFFRYGSKRKNCKGCGACGDVCPEIPDVDISSDPADCIRCYICSPSPCMKSWDVRVDLEKCKACGLCYRLCPTGALEKGKGGKPAFSKPAQCSGCGMCVRRCPEIGMTLAEQSGAQAAVEAVK